MQPLRTMALGAALVVGITTAAAAQTPQQTEQEKQRTAQADGRRGGGRMARSMFRSIELTDQQRAQIRAIREKYQPQRRELLKSARANTRDGNGERRQRSDSATMAQVRSLSERELAEMRAVLTPAQQPTFDENVARMQKHGREMRHGGRQGRRS